MRHPLREQGVVVSDAGPGGHTHSSGDTSGDMGDDAAVEIGGDHDVELTRVLDKLHRAIVDDHLLVLDEGILLGDVPGSLQEEAID